MPACAVYTASSDYSQSPYLMHLPLLAYLTDEWTITLRLTSFPFLFYAGSDSKSDSQQEFKGSTMDDPATQSACVFVRMCLCSLCACSCCLWACCSTERVMCFLFSQPACSAHISHSLFKTCTKLALTFSHKIPLNTQMPLHSLETGGLWMSQQLELLNSRRF